MISIKKLLFIFNPVSGFAKIRNELFKIIDFYEKHGFLVTVYATQKKGDAYQLLKTDAEAYDIIVCSGGDGTVNEVVNGMMDFNLHIPIAYIPSGSANDLGRSVGIPSDLTEALETSVNRNITSIDVGKFNDKYFTYVAAFGIFTNIPYTTPQEMKNKLGYQAYLIEGIKNLASLKTYHIQLEYDDGKIEDDFIVGLITNSFSVAGIKNTISKGIELNDGLFEVILVKAPKNIQDFQKTINEFLINQESSEQILCLKTSKVIIHSEPMEWTIDGEDGGTHANVIIENIKERFEIFCNRK